MSKDGAAEYTTGTTPEKKISKAKMVASKSQQDQEQITTKHEAIPKIPNEIRKR